MKRGQTSESEICGRVAMCVRSGEAGDTGVTACLAFSFDILATSFSNIISPPYLLASSLWRRPGPGANRPDKVEQGIQLTSEPQRPSRRFTDRLKSRVSTARPQIGLQRSASDVDVDEGQA
nr:hypothetical protein Iba_chr02fCG10570 [Ipomoea batatas]